MSWGDKGEVYAPKKCEHEPDDGCMWCCERCNHDRHFCPGCGTISDHRESACNPCVNNRTGEVIEAPMFAKGCDMGFCDIPGKYLLRAFGNDEERWYCEEHGELAKANIEATTGEGDA